MKKTLSLICTILTNYCYAQVPFIKVTLLKERPQVYYHSTEINNQQCDSSIKNVTPTSMCNKLKVKYKNGHKKMFIPCDSVWGYRQNHGLPTRIYKGMPCTLIADQLIAGHPLDLYRVNMLSLKFQQHYFFSQGLDSRLICFTEKDLWANVDSATYNKVLGDEKLRNHLCSNEYSDCRCDTTYFSIKK